MAGLSLAFGVSWFTIMDRLGAATWAGVELAARALAQLARDWPRAASGAQARKEAVEAGAEEGRAARAAAHRGAGSRSWRRASASRRSARCRCSIRRKSSELPPLKLLDDPPPREPLYSAEALEALSRLVEMKLKDFGVEAEVVAVQPGPVVTRFEMRPAPGVKASQITALAKDLARALSVLSACAWSR